MKIFQQYWQSYRLCDGMSFLFWTSCKCKAKSQQFLEMGDCQVVKSNALLVGSHKYWLVLQRHRYHRGQLFLASSAWAARVGPQTSNRKTWVPYADRLVASTNLSCITIGNRDTPGPTITILATPMILGRVGRPIDFAINNWKAAGRLIWRLPTVKLKVNVKVNVDLYSASSPEPHL